MSHWHDKAADNDRKPLVTQQDARLAKRLRHGYGERTKNLDDEQLLKFVREGIASAAAIKIAEEDDVFRFLALRFVLSPEQQSSPLIKSVAIRIFDHFAWDAKKRLNFIYKHVVNRQPSSSESDLSTFFVIKTRGEHHASV